MGKVLSIATRKVNRINVENRAHKVISKAKPTLAPKYSATVKEMDRVMTMYPNLVDELNKKDQTLDDRLKHVYVKRLNLSEQFVCDSTKSLPVNRSTPEDFEYGFKEPETLNVKVGKCSLRQAMQFIADHQTNPNKYTAKCIATQYKLKESYVEDLLKFFKTFYIHVPNKDSKGQMLMEPNLSKQYLAHDEYK